MNLLKRLKKCEVELNISKIEFFKILSLHTEKGFDPLRDYRDYRDGKINLYEREIKKDSFKLRQIKEEDILSDFDRSIIYAKVIEKENSIVLTYRVLPNLFVIVQALLMFSLCFYLLINLIINQLFTDYKTMLILAVLFPLLYFSIKVDAEDDKEFIEKIIKKASEFKNED